MKKIQLARDPASAFRRTPIAAAVSALLLPAAAFSQAAPANANPDSVLETVVVTGMRHAVETAVAIKRNSDSIVEAVTSEDLGKLPDVSIADALARLPGVTAQRVDGRSEVITIRGLAPKYGVTLLNGREFVSTGDNRAVEFDQFPAELIAQATVYKTPDAALGVQGLSGTINLETLKPLSVSGQRMTFNARAEKNSNGALVPGSKATGARISYSYVDQFADNTIGVAFGFAHLDSPGQEKYTKSWWWGNSAIWWGGFRGLENANPEKAPSTLQGFEAGVASTKHVRDGAIGVIEFKPHEGLHSEVDLYFSRFKQEASGREFQASLMPNWSGNGTPDAPVNGGPIYSNVGLTNHNGMDYATSGAISNVDPIMVSRWNEREDRIMAIGWNTQLRTGDWTNTLDLSFSHAKRNETVAEMYASAPTMTGFSDYNSPLGSGYLSYTPTTDWSDPANLRLRGISGWGNLNGNAQAGSLSPIEVTDATRALRLSTERDLDAGIFNKIEVGVNLTHREKDYYETQEIFALANGTPCVNAGDTCAAIPSSMLQSPVDLGFAGIPSMLSFSVQDAINSGAYLAGASNVSSAPGRIWTVNETITTAFTKLGLKFQAGIPWHGNFGVQLVHSQQKSTGVAWDHGIVPMAMGTSYNDVLPSLNLIGDFTNTFQMHFGLAKVLARPNMDDMRAGYSAGISGADAQPPGRWSGSGGNPYLNPWRADQIDLSFTKFFGRRSYLSVAGFRKNLKTSIYVADENFDFSGFPNSTGAVVNPAYGNIGILSAPVNGKGGFVKGLELSGTFDFGLWARSLDGIGLQASFSSTSSNVPGVALNGSGQADFHRPLEGMSGKVSSIVAYYENHGWEFRVAQRYRSDFIASVRGVWIATSEAAILSERITDLQLGYNFETGRMAGLSLLLQVNNLSDEPYRTTSNDDSFTQLHTSFQSVPERYQRYGREYLVGFNYKIK